jgi:SpoVK/Ycf46/Vps4 family AAA+-type ATPase
MAEITALLGSEATKKAIRVAYEKERVKAETDVMHSGSAIILPENVTIPEVIELLQRKHDAAQLKIEINELISGFPYDAAVAFYRAMQERFGFTCGSAYDVKTMFGKERVNPEVLQIRVGPKPGDIIQIPHGGFLIRGIEQPIKTRLYWSRRSGEMGLTISAELRAKDRETIRELCARATEILRTQSIYKGKALILRTDESGHIHESAEPEFMETDGIDPSQLILNADTMAQIDNYFWGVIRHTDAFRAAGLPLNPRVLLPGEYGTGKSLLMRTTAKLCVDHGWTFIQVNDPRCLREALEFAEAYQPCVVAVEDVDRVTEVRDDKTNMLFNAISGMGSVDNQVMLVMTTNHEEKIDKAMLRHGRVDKIINLRTADADTAERLVRRYAGTRLPADTDLSRLRPVITGHIAATLANVANQALSAMIVRGGTSITEDDLLIAAHSVEAHATMFREKPATTVKSPEELAGIALKQLMNGHDAQITSIHANVKEVHAALC